MHLARSMSAIRCRADCLAFSSSILILAYKSLGHGNCVKAPVPWAWLSIMVISYVDDTDLFIMDKCVKSSYDIWKDSQGALTAWGKLLVRTGGLLKPEKYFYYLVDYEWLEDGSWTYANMVDDYQLLVPQSDGNGTPIHQLPVFREQTKEDIGHLDRPSRQLFETGGGDLGKV